jgi:hypothetical protein
MRYDANLGGYKIDCDVQGRPNAAGGSLLPSSQLNRCVAILGASDNQQQPPALCKPVALQFIWQCLIFKNAFFLDMTLCSMVDTSRTDI